MADKHKNYNPRMVAYMMVMGYTSYKERWERDNHGNHPFTHWMDERWKEFHKEVIPLEGTFFVKAHQEEFDEWFDNKFPGINEYAKKYKLDQHSKAI